VVPIDVASADVSVDALGAPSLTPGDRSSTRAEGIELVAGLYPRFLFDFE